MMLIKLAFRNLLRNRRRTYITATAIGLGLACLILLDGFIIGFEQNTIKNVTTTFLGEAQIHHPNFKIYQEVEYLVKNLDEVETQLKSNSKIAFYSKRTLSPAMLSSAANMRNVQLIGVIPEMEREISRLHLSIREGRHLLHSNEILIGQGLAGRLKLKINEKLVVTTAEAKSGELKQDLMRVAGIFKFGARELDNDIAFILLKKSQELIDVGDQVHEVVLKFKKLEESANADSPIFKSIQNTGNQVEYWGEIVPAIRHSLEMSTTSTGIISAVLIFLVVLAVINTMFMSLYERLFEFGVLRAIGTKAFQIVILVVCESGLLALFSIAIGYIITGILGYILITKGIDYTGLEMGDVTFNEPIYFVPRTYQFIYYPTLMFFWTLAAGLYPAIYASRITLAKAIKKSL